MTRRWLAGSADLLLIGSFFVVLCYNAWSLCCGRCTAATFLNPGPFGMLLLALNLLALLFLVTLKLRRRRSLSRQHCLCGATLGTEWHYCPVCGRPARS